MRARAVRILFANRIAMPPKPKGSPTRDPSPPKPAKSNTSVWTLGILVAIVAVALAVVPGLASAIVQVGARALLHADGDALMDVSYNGTVSLPMHTRNLLLSASYLRGHWQRPPFPLSPCTESAFRVYFHDCASSHCMVHAVAPASRVTPASIQVAPRTLVRVE